MNTVNRTCLHFPVEGCNGGGRYKFGLYQHFNLIHAQADIFVAEDGPIPKCPLRGLRSKDLQKHQQLRTCGQARQRRTNEQKQDEQYKAGKVEFTVNGKKLQQVKQFRYLGRIFTDNDRW